MKELIFQYLKSDRSFDTGMKLYQKYGRNKALLRKCNLQGETPHNLEVLHYQLFKLTGEPEPEFFKIILRKVQPAPEPEPIPEETIPEGGDDKKPPLTVIEATKVKLREEFPFLSEKECPDAFKVLVADMLTAYENYVKAHEDLFNITNEDEAFEAADKLMENYLENRAIWSELEHYKKEGKILGEHPYFEDRKRRAKITNMAVPDLIKLHDNLEHNIWRNKRKMEEDPKPHLVKSRQKRIDEYERDLGFVKSLLDRNE